MKWLARSFGIDRLLNAPIVVPSKEFFPTTFEPNETHTQQLMHRICGWMKVDPSRLQLAILPDDAMPGAAGQYVEGEITTIRIASSQLQEPQRLVATLAHELAHALLLGERRLDTSVADHEWVTDLLPVYLGLGIFAANSTLRERNWQEGALSWWSIGRQGYLQSRMFGYALALFAFIRDEKDLSWAEHLRHDALVPLREGLQFLRKSTDAIFHPATIRDSDSKSIDALRGQLRSGSPTFRLDALWHLRDLGLEAAPAVVDVIHAMKDKEVTIGAEAIAALAAIGPAAGASVAPLAAIVANPSSQLRSAAATALNQVRGDPAEVIPAALTLLDDPAHMLSGFTLIQSYGSDASMAWPRVIHCFEEVVTKGLEEEAEAAADTLLAIKPNGYENVCDHFQDIDPLVRKDALRIYRRMAKVQ